MTRRATTCLLLATQTLGLALAIAQPASAAAPTPASRPITQVLAAQRAQFLRNVRYEVHLDLTGSAGFTGTTTLRFDGRPAKGDLIVDFADGSVSRVLVNGRPVAVRHSAGQLVLPGRNLGRTNTVTVTFTGRYGANGFGLTRFVDPEDKKVYCYTDLEPDGAHHVFPCFDQPDLKARTTLKATTPAGWTVLSNQAPVRKEARGTKQTVHFAPTPPLSPYLIALHAGHYVGWHDKAGKIPLGIYTRASLAKHMDADVVFEITKQGLAHFGAYFAYAYPFAKYDQIFVPEYQHGAMENPGAVTFNEKFIYRSKPTDSLRYKRDNVILHEMAHMWFGDLVTMRWWNDLWLNESFATYMAAHAKAALPRYGDTWEKFYGQKQWAYSTDARRTTHPIRGPVPDTEVATGIFDGITYGKGASVMKQLSYFIGPDAFRDGLRTYFKRHAWQNATLADFLGALQQHTTQDLSVWGQHWLGTSGLNTVTPQWSCANGTISDFNLEQGVRSGENRLRPHRTELALLAPGKDGKLVVQTRLPVAYDTGLNPVPELKGKPCPVMVFPNLDDQDYALTVLDPVSLATAQRALSDIAEPLLRLQVWDGLWQMVRDQRLDPLSYLDTVQRHLPKETNPTAIETQLGALSTLVLHDLDPETRRQLLPGIETFVWGQLDRQVPGSDLQQLWANTTIELSRSPEGQKRLLDWLQSPERIKGLALDQDRRWSILATLTACGHPGAKALVGQEKGRDSSDRGLRILAQINALVPDLASKHAAWERITTDRTSSISSLTAVMDGFGAPEQGDLVRPYADHYFDSLLPIYKTRPYAFAKRFTERMFPRYGADAAVVARAQAMAAQKDLPAELRKWLSDLTENLERQVALQGMATVALKQRLAQSKR